MNADCYVITIDTNPRSISASKRCIDSGNKVGLYIQLFNAFTPTHDPLKTLESKDINTKVFYDASAGSYPESAAGCFLSHFALWEKCIETNKPIIIFEHDAIIINEIPLNILDGTGFDQVVNLGKPAHGEFKIPEGVGVDLFVASQGFKGTHAYAIKPSGALKLTEQAKVDASAVDVFINTKTFPFLQDLYPWPVISKLEFSTIQKQANRYSTNIQLDEFGNSRARE